MNYEEEYYKKREMLTKKILDTTEKLENIVLEYEKINDDDTVVEKEKKLDNIKNEAFKVQSFLHLLKMEKKYSRIGTRETEEEKSRIYHNFANELKGILSPKYNYCFHGCRYIYIVKALIERGIITSNVDNYDSDNNNTDQISVSTINTFDVTINNYSGLTNSTSQPAGAIFILSPKDQNEIESSKRMIINSVNFKENPGRLKYILTTTENKERIVKWCIENSIDFDKVLTYDEFLSLALENQNRKSL